MGGPIQRSASMLMFTGPKRAAGRRPDDILSDSEGGEARTAWMSSYSRGRPVEHRVDDGHRHQVDDDLTVRVRGLLDEAVAGMLHDVHPHRVAWPARRPGGPGPSISPTNRVAAWTCGGAGAPWSDSAVPISELLHEARSTDAMGAIEAQSALGGDREGDPPLGPNWL